MNGSTAIPTISDRLDPQFKRLIQNAQGAGASGAKIVSSGEIVINEALADLCRENQCGNYGLSKSCPPHVDGPVGLKRRLADFNWAAVFKIDVPSAMLVYTVPNLSPEARAVFQLLHEVAASVESLANAIGFRGAQAFAGGSCKQVFCYRHPQCQALLETGKCRYPQLAKPSMSGFGIDVERLFESCGWKMNWVFTGRDVQATAMAAVCGMVLM